MRDIPTATPISLMIGFQAVKMQYGTLQADKVVRTPWAIHYRDAIDIMRVYDIEFAFPTNIKHPVLAVKAVRKVIEITEKYAYEGKVVHDCKFTAALLHICVHTTSSCIPTEFLTPLTLLYTHYYWPLIFTFDCEQCKHCFP